MFDDVVKLALAGKPIIVRFDDSPLEDREPNGDILCGPKAENGYLGIFIAGASYEIMFDAKLGSWKSSGPNQRNGRYKESCAPLETTHTVADLKPMRPRPENGDLIIWGAPFRFDAALAVHDAKGQKVGTVRAGP